MFEASRGWSAEELAQARAGLEDRGLVDATGATHSGRRLRRDIETMTDRLAAAPLSGLGQAPREHLLEALVPIASAIAEDGLIPYPNPYPT